MENDSRRIPLPHVGRALKEQYGRSVPYHSLWRQILAGEIAAEQEGRLWLVPATELPTIARLFGLDVGDAR